jgi:hypothetical protein
MNYPLKLKKHLAKKMAKVDQEAMGLNYEECYELMN